MGLLILFFLIVGVPLAFGNVDYIEFEDDGYKLYVDNPHVIDIDLQWDSEHGPSGIILFDEPINGTITLKIPLSMPRMTNLDFGPFNLFVLEDDYTTPEITETKSLCFDILKIPVNNSDRVEIIGASLAAGNFELTSEPPCDDSTLKQQLSIDGMFDATHNQNTNTSISLHQQIQNNVKTLYCNDIEHILVIRPNLDYACLTEQSNEIVQWTPVTFTSNGDAIIKNSEPLESHGEKYLISYEITNGLLSDLQTSSHADVIFFNIDSINNGTATVTIPKSFYTEELFSPNNELIVYGNFFGEYLFIDNSDNENYIISFNFTLPQIAIEISIIPTV